MNSNNRPKIGTFQLAMITVAYVASVRSMPTIAEYGFSCLFFYLIAALTFLVPSALVSAELATAWPERGGIYVWVKNALGQRWGFLAIWLQLLANIVGLPALLSFLAATTAYIFMPSLAHNRYFLIGFILIVFWGSTFISFFGMKTAGWINSIGATIGTLIPASIVIIMGAAWLIMGKPTQIVMSWGTLIPDVHAMHLNDLVFLAGLMYGLTGMEVSGAHALDVKDANKNYPKGIFLAVVLVLIVGFGSLSIAMVVPQHSLSLVAGVMQAFSAFFDYYHLPWMVPILATAIVIGLTGCLNSSVIGPSKGLFGTASGGDIPPFLAKLNKHGMPYNIFIAQAIVVSVISLVFLYMPSASSSYWLIMSVVSILYLLMYVLLFISGIVARYKYPDVERTYKIPGKNIGMWIVSGLGLASTIFVTSLAFFPPNQLKVGNTTTYEIMLITGVLFFIGLGFLMFAMRKPSWVIEHKEVE
ncbi:MAG: amino acid permease [Gammaproteobacteria bacterium]|nr:amino acid permease [Gammaproteobacteria bacterium]